MTSPATGPERNAWIADAVVRAGLLDPTVARRVWVEADAARIDLAVHLQSRGLVRPDALAVALGESAPTMAHPGPAAPPSSGRLAATPGGMDGAASPAPRAATASGSVSDVDLVRRALRAPPGAELPSGTRLGPYRLVRLLARGGMGAVFVGEHEVMRRTVALKVLLAGDGAGPEEVERFLREARTAAKLSHPNVVPIFEVGEEEGLQFLTMELVDGPSLRALIRDEGPLEARRALALVAQVAGAVAAAHAEGIVHRDLKPENVLVAEGDVAKVMDFGLAKEVDDGGAGLTVSGALLGTPAYMAPEQAAGEEAGPLADVYGIGAILYECLTGRPPFQGPTLVNIINQVLNREPEAPRAIRSELARDVETICLHALEKDPARRYPSARELADDARRWVAGEAITARPPTAIERLRRGLRRNRAAAAAVTVGLLAATAASAWFALAAPELAARRRAAEAIEVADAFARDVEAGRSAIDAILERVTLLDEPDLDDADDIDGSIDAATRHALEEAVEAATKIGRAAWEARADELGPEEEALARARLDDRLEPDPFDEVGAVEARVYRTLGLRRSARADELDGAAEADRALADTVDPDVPDGALAADQARARFVDARRRGLRVRRRAREAFAMACAIDPDGPEGLASLAELASALEGPAAIAALGHLLEEDRSPERDRLLIARSSRRLSGLDFALAADELAGLGPREQETSAALVELVGSLAPVASLRIDDARERDPLQVVRVVPGDPPRLAVFADDGHLRTFVLGADGELELTAEVDGPELRRGEEVVAAAVGGTARDPIRAYFTGPTNRLIVDRGGVVKVFARQSTPVGEGLRFIELDDDPATSELACVLGTDEADGLYLRFEPGRAVGSKIGHANPRSAGTQFPSAFIDGPLGPDGARRLVMAYGVWEAFWIKIFGADPTRPLAPPKRIGTVRGLALADVDGDGGNEIVAVHIREAVAIQSATSPPGLAVWASDGRQVLDRVFHRPHAALEVDPAEQILWEVEGLHLVRPRRGGRLYALWAATPVFGERGGRAVERSRLRIVEVALEGALLNLDLPAGEAERIVASGDLDGDGDDEIVVRRGRAGLDVHGVGAARPDVSGRRRLGGGTSIVSVLGGLGFDLAAIEAVTRRIDAQGRSDELEDAWLSLLDRRERDTQRLPDGVLLDEIDRFRDRVADPVALARVTLIEARHLARGRTAALDRDLVARLAHVAATGADLSPVELADQERLQRLVQARGTSPDSRRSVVEIDFRRSGAADLEQLEASDPVRARLEPRTGLVASVARDVTSWAGVPVEIREGLTRLVVDFSIERRTWAGQIEVGLFRDLDELRGLTDPMPPEPATDRAIEGLTIGAKLWATGSASTFRQPVVPGVGRPVQSRPLRPGAVRDALGEIVQTELRGGRVYRARLRAILEHDAPTRWTRFVLRDLTDVEGEAGDSGDGLDEGAGVELLRRDGRSTVALSSGPYLAGFYSAAWSRKGQGDNTPPSARVVVERIRIEGDDLESVRVGRGQRDVRARAVRRAVRLDLVEDPAARIGAAEAVARAYDRAVAEADDPLRRTTLLLERLDLETRHPELPRGEAAPAIAALLDACPLALMLAVIRFGDALSPGAQSALRVLIRDALGRAPPAATSPEAALGRAILCFLRGEGGDATRPLADALDREDRAETAPVRAVLRRWEALCGLGRRLPFWPGLARLGNGLSFQTIPRLWLPPVEAGVAEADLDRFFAARVEAVRRERAAILAGVDEASFGPVRPAVHDLLVVELSWLSRWESVRPGRIDLLTQRALLIENAPRLFKSFGVRGAPLGNHAWRARDDLRQVVARRPDDAGAIVALCRWWYGFRDHGEIRRLLLDAEARGVAVLDLARRRLPDGYLERRVLGPKDD